MAQANLTYDDVYDPMPIRGGTDYPLNSLPRAVEGYGLDSSPDYQRGHVWTPEQQQKFMGHLLEGGYMAPLIINEIGDGLTYELVDGKQRLQAGLEFLLGAIGGRLTSGRLVMWRDFDEVSQRRFSNHIYYRFNRIKLPRAAVLRLYIKLNSGGVVHTPQEIAKVKRLLRKEAQKGQ